MLNKHLFNRRTNGWRDGWTDGRTDGWMNGQMDSRRDRWADRGEDGQTNRSFRNAVYVPFSRRPRMTPGPGTGGGEDGEGTRVASFRFFPRGLHRPFLKICDKDLCRDCFPWRGSDTVRRVCWAFTLYVTQALNGRFRLLRYLKPSLRSPYCHSSIQRVSLFLSKCSCQERRR